MAANHKKNKNPRGWFKSETAIIESVNALIQPYGVVTALGPDAVGVFGDARLVGLAVIVRFNADADVMFLATQITNRVRGVARVLLDLRCPHG